jgi:hypothetical protein
MCKYCKYCKMCRFCGQFCQAGGMVDSFAGYASTVASTLGFAPSQDEIDSVSQDLGKVDWDLANKGQRTPVTPEADEL